MAKKTQGNVFEIISGEHSGRKALAFYDEQDKETIDAGKVVLHLLKKDDNWEEQKILKDATTLKRIGKCD